MRANEFLTESYLYHVTFTKNVDGILKDGLLQFQTSNWAKGDGGRYNEDAGIFAFDHPIDAINWANKTQYEFETRDVSIIRINPSEVWGQDPTQDVNLVGGRHGRPMRSSQNIDASDIVDVFDVDKEFGSPMTRNMSRDEWLTDTANRLEK